MVQLRRGFGSDFFCFWHGMTAVFCWVGLAVCPSATDETGIGHRASRNLYLSVFPRPDAYACIYSPFSALNLSHASFSVLNTVAAIMRTSVDASCGSCSNPQSQHSSLSSLRAPHQNLPCRGASWQWPSCS